MSASNGNDSGSSNWITHIVVGVFCGVIVLGVICIAVVIVVMKIKKKKEAKSQSMASSQKRLKMLRERKQMQDKNNSSKTETSTNSTKSQPKSKKSQRQLAPPPKQGSTKQIDEEQEESTPKLPLKNHNENQKQNPAQNHNQQQKITSPPDQEVMKTQELSNEKIGSEEVVMMKTAREQSKRQVPNENVRGNSQENDQPNIPPANTTIICNYNGAKKWSVRNKPPPDFSFSIESD